MSVHYEDKTMKFYVYPYKQESRSAGALAEALNGLRLKVLGSTFRYSDNKKVINWGSHTCPFPCLNDPDNVIVAANKLSSLNVLKESSATLPAFTTSQSEAMGWLTEGKVVMARTLLNASGGRGIIVITKPEEMVTAPLYTRYIPKTEEYRVHVVNGHCIDVQRKMRKGDVPDDKVNWKVRNLDGGFIYGREGVTLDSSVTGECCRAIHTLGLDFGAVDLIYNRVHNKYYILEVNTAPGLMGTTLTKYTEAFRVNYS